MEGFKKLIEENPDDVNYVTHDEGRSLLHFAASVGNVECMKILILQVKKLLKLLFNIDC